jgi:small-conductance mechanosensitive channel
MQKFLYSLAALVVIYFSRWLFMRIWHRNVQEDYVKIYKWQKNSSYIALVLSIFVIGRIWFEGFSSIATFLGILSAGLAIALKDLIADLAGWMFILWRHPFEIGDRIEIDENKGDVIDISPFKFTVVEIGNWVGADQSTGRVIHVPNHKVFTGSIANYTVGFRFIWDEIPVLITFESDWRKMKTFLQKLIDEQYKDLKIDARDELRKAARSYMIVYNVLTPIVYTNVKDSGIELTTRYISDPRKRRKGQQEIWEAILDYIEQEPDIDLAYPTMRIYNNAREGKMALRQE